MIKQTVCILLIILLSQASQNPTVTLQDQQDVLFGKAQAGYCVKSNGFDEEEGQVQLSSKLFQTQEEQCECLTLCTYYSDAEVTACEINTTPEGQGCYAHTNKDLDHGSGDKKFFCWLKTEDQTNATTLCDHIEEQKKEQDEQEKVEPQENGQKALFGKRQDGFCVKENNEDENEGVHKLADFKQFVSDEEQCECLELCSKFEGITGCEIIVNTGNKGCYAHTSTQIHHGNGVDNHNCWLVTKDVLKATQQCGVPENYQEEAQKQQQEEEQQQQEQDDDCSILYDQCYFQGNQIRICDQVPDFDGFVVRSIYIPDDKTVTVFEETEFGGEQHVFEYSDECIDNFQFGMQAIQVKGVSKRNLKRNK